MKYLLFTFANLIFITLLGSAQCPNGDVEQNSFLNYDLFIGNNPMGQNTNFVDITAFTIGTGGSSNQGIPRHDIVTPGTDPIVGSNLQRVLAGNHAIKLGNEDNGAESEIISYTFPIPASKKISFSWSAVLQDPSHVPAHQPFVAFWISRSNTLVNSLDPGIAFSNSLFKKVADLNDPFWNMIDIPPFLGKVLYKDWQQECIDLSDEITEENQLITLYFMVADCSEGDHFGYAYIDNICLDDLSPCFTAPTSVCDLDKLIVDGSCSVNIPNCHEWRFGKLNSNNINDFTNLPMSQIGLSGPDFCGPIGTKNFGSLQIVKDIYSFSGPGFYQIDLIFKNCSGDDIVSSKIIYIDAPWVKGTDLLNCCTDDANVLLVAQVDVSDPNNIGTFEWTDNNGNLISTFDYLLLYNSNNVVIGIQTTLHTPKQSGRYKVVYKTPDGCVGEKTLNVLYVGDYSISIIKEECFTEKTPCGNRKLYAKLNEIQPCPFDNWALNNLELWESLVSNNHYLSYQWNTGETTPFIYTQPAISNYSITVNGFCGTKTTSLTVLNNTFPGEPIKKITPQPTAPYTSNTPPHLWITSVISPSLNECFKVFHATKPSNYLPAYNAYRYELKIFNQWGTCIATEIGQNLCEGLYNGQIQWCAPSNLDVDTYAYTLRLWSCDFPDCLVAYGFFDLVN